MSGSAATELRPNLYLSSLPYPHEPVWGCSYQVARPLLNQPSSPEASSIRWRAAGGSGKAGARAGISDLCWGRLHGALPVLYPPFLASLCRLETQARLVLGLLGRGDASAPTPAPCTWSTSLHANPTQPWILA